VSIAKEAAAEVPADEAGPAGDADVHVNTVAIK
jgi:hypothetical protein